MSKDTKHFHDTARIKLRLGTRLPRQINTLARERNMTPEILAHQARIQLKRIVRMLGDGYTEFDLDDLAQLAAALEVDLDITFVPRKEN